MRSLPFSSVRMRRAGPDGKAFTAIGASPEVRAFAQLARSQSTEVDLLAGSIGACFSLCDTPAGTFECAWPVSPLIDLEHYIRGMMAEYSVTDERLETETVIGAPRAVLEWPCLRFVEEHPARLDIPSWAIRGDQDEVIPFSTLSRFVDAPGASSSRSRAARALPWPAPTPRHGGCVVRGTLSGLTDRSAAACLRRIYSLS